MGKKRKKSYKKDTVSEEKAASKLAEMHTKYDDDELIEEVLLGMPDNSTDPANGGNIDIYDILGEERPEGEPHPAEESAEGSDATEEEASAAEKAEMMIEDLIREEAAGVGTADEEPVDTAQTADNGSGDAAPEVKTDAGESVLSDTDTAADISEAVKAAIAEKAANGSVTKAAAQAEKNEKPAKQKKQSKKKAPETEPLKPILRIANIVYSAAAFAIITVAFLALPREGVSETEQRNLAEFPTFSFSTFMNGEYTNGITEYFNDNVPYRDELKKAGAFIRNLFGVSYNDAEIIGPVAVITEAAEPVPAATEPEQTTAATSAVTEPTETSSRQTSPSAEQTATAETTTAPVTTTKHIETTKNVNEIAEGVVTNGQVVTKLSDGHWRGISLFGGGNGTTYANALNRFKQELGDSVNVWSMPVPTAGEYYLPDIYASYNASHQKSIDAIDSQLVGVKPVPASMALWEHVSEPIYLRTDHHWQPLGAYYAAKCFAETAGVPFADISTMERVDIPGYMGTMYSFTQNAKLLSDPEVFTYYKPTNSYTTYYYDTSYNFTGQFPFFLQMPVNGSYSTFMGADNKIVRITTDAGTGRKLVIFKDSYGNAEIPFYFGSFDEIYVCDMRYFDLNAVRFVQFTGATDLLFTMCTFSAVGTNANGLETILNNPVTEITESVNDR